jgi:hypothetical protein
LDIGVLTRCFLCGRTTGAGAITSLNGFTRFGFVGLGATATDEKLALVLVGLGASDFDKNGALVADAKPFVGPLPFLIA